MATTGKTFHFEEIITREKRFRYCLKVIDTKSRDKDAICIDTLKDGIKERDEAMQTMTKTLVEKGETNRRLSETVNTIKNQLLIDKVFDQKFIVQ